MDFQLSEQQLLIRNMMRQFAEGEIAPVAAQIDRSGEFPRQCIRKLADLGLFGILIPPAYGGEGPDKLGFLIALEELAAASGGFALSVGVSCAVSSLILEMGNGAQKARYLPDMAQGKRLGAMANAEHTGGANSAFTMQCTARPDQDSYILNGTKCFISNAGEADIYVVTTRTAPEDGLLGISGLIVEKDTPGLSFGKTEEKLGLRCDVTRELIFENCRVPKANLLAECILIPLLAAWAKTEMPMFGAIALGLSRAALEAATQYVKSRSVAYNQTLSNFDVIQYMLADMTTKVEAARLLVYQAGSLSEQKPDLTLSAMAGIFPCEVALEVTSQALQLFGGYGYTADFPLERYFRDARGLTLIAQPMELRKLVLSRLKLGLPPVSIPGGMSN